MRTILVVEDDPVFREALEVALRKAGYRTLVTGQASVASTLLSAERPDLVLLDLGLHGESGLSVLTRIRSDPALAVTPVIVLSGMSSVSLDAQLGGLGVQAQLIKSGFSPKNLMRRISKIFESQGPAHAP